MNIAYSQPSLVIAKTCGPMESKQKVTYTFSEEFHSLCIDKKDIIEAQIQACERLLKYATNEQERRVVEKEIAELKLALDLMP
jgi:hypothetical protein